VTEIAIEEAITLQSHLQVPSRMKDDARYGPVRCGDYRRKEPRDRDGVTTSSGVRANSYTT
jgi:hypothetical protein